MFVSSIMTRNVLSVERHQSLHYLVEVFSKVNFRHLLVAENNQLLGVISDRDVLRNTCPLLGTSKESTDDRELLDKCAADIMSSELITVSTDTLIDSASILLIENSISCLPVVDDENNIAGILSWKDILKFHVYDSENSVAEE